jgi:hypothetical protein
MAERPCISPSGIRPRQTTGKYTIRLFCRLRLASRCGFATCRARSAGLPARCLTGRCLPDRRLLHSGTGPAERKQHGQHQHAACDREPRCRHTAATSDTHNRQTHQCSGVEDHQRRKNNDNSQSQKDAHIKGGSLNVRSWSRGYGHLHRRIAFDCSHRDGARKCLPYREV